VDFEGSDNKIDMKNNSISKIYYYPMNTKVKKSVVLPKQVVLDRSLPVLTAEEVEYLDSLDVKEKQAYEIAKSHLGSTFHLMKSNGFIEWKKTKIIPS